MTRTHRLATLFTLFAVLLCPLLVSAQQPVQALGSGVQNTSDAAWTSATGSNTAVQFLAGVSKYNTVLVTLVQGSTITGGVVTFEQSIDNSTFTPVQGVTLGTTVIMGPTYTLTPSTNVSFLFPVNAPYFQIRLSTVISGSGTVTVQHSTQSLPTAALLAGTETLAAGTNSIGTVGLNAGSNLIGGINLQQVLGANLSKTNPVFDQLTDGTNSIAAAISALGSAPTGTDVMTVNAVEIPYTSGGLSVTTLYSAASTNVTSVKGSAGQALRLEHLQHFDGDRICAHLQHGFWERLGWQHDARDVHRDPAHGRLEFQQHYRHRIRDGDFVRHGDERRLQRQRLGRGGRSDHQHSLQLRMGANKFSANATWTCPKGVTQAIVECWGAGGGGGGANNNNASSEGGGGGGGEYRRILVTGMTGNGTQTFAVTVGTGGGGGTGPANGANGNLSSFNNNGAGNVCVANGGIGGAFGRNAVGANGAGGSGGTGSTGFNGGHGANGNTSANNGGGGGGAASNNQLGTSATTSTGAALTAGPTGDNARCAGGNGGNGGGRNGNGANGVIPGGGGGGGGRCNGTNTVGGTGANGQVIVTWGTQFSDMGTGR